MNDFAGISKEFAEGTVREGLRQRSVLEHGTRSAVPIVQRWVILDVIFDPSTIDRTKLEYWEHDLGVTNMQHCGVAPRNSIIAKRVQSNNTTSSEPAMILYPFMPPSLSFPCQPGEHVWVMFEDPAGTRNDLGYWMWRIVGPHHAEDVNHSHPHRAHDPSFVPGTQDTFEGSTTPKYEFRNGVVGETDGERYTIAETAALPDLGEKAYEDLITESDGGKLSQKEAIPRFKKRPGDLVIEGTNNALITLGTDRTGPIAVYTDDATRGKRPSYPDDEPSTGSGSIDIVVGRGQTSSTSGNVAKNSLDFEELAKGSTEIIPEEGDPDLKNDRSRIRVSQKTKVDANFNLQAFNGEFSIEDDGTGTGAIVLKTDKLRLIARSDIELVVTNFERDSRGRMMDASDASKWAAIVIKSDGSIVIRPAENNVIKLGSDKADKAILTVDIPATVVNGQVSAPPILTTMGGQINTKVSGQGGTAKKILVD